MPKEAKPEHIPVLADEVIKILSPKPGESYLDLTAGRGGHAKQILEVTKAPEQAILVDRDSRAVALLGQDLGSTKIIHQDFFGASQDLAQKHERFDLILADLGVSSMHLNDASRGFSFKNSGPLDMRMDSDMDRTAYHVVNSYSKDKLSQILKDFGDEPKAQQIARLIVKSRPIKTTDQLASLVKSVWRGPSKVHPATRTFQAIRIEVNDEIGQIERSLPIWLKLLSPNGRLAIISFHSLEDRLVKKFLSDHSVGLDAELALISKKPIVASNKEIVFNPRARSAKLRAAVKIKNLELD